MIKKFNDFLIEATNKFGNTFSYIEETFKRYSCDTMTIIHNESNIKFEMIPLYHINSQTGIPDDIAYKILCPYEKFIEEAKLKLKDEFHNYEFIEESYQGYQRAMVIYKNKVKYFISPNVLLRKLKLKLHFYTEDEIDSYKELISKYTYIKDFRAENKHLYKTLSDAGFSFLWKHLDYKKDRVIYSEEYLRNLMLTYKKEGKSRSQFVMEHGSEHAYIRRNNLIHLYYDCSLTVSTNLPQGIYACEFILDDGKYAYVGLTFNFKERESDHRGADEYSTVYKFMKQRNLSQDKMHFRIIIRPEDCEDASKSETEIFEKYKNDGWIMLNIVPTGSKGHSALIKYTKEDIIKIIKDNNLKTVHDLYIKNRRAWITAREEGYLDELLERKTHKKKGNFKK